MLHGKVSLLQVVQGRDEREVVPHLAGWLVVTVEHGIVDGTFQRLDVLRVEIVAHVVAKRPDDGHVGVGVLHPLKVLAAYPSVFVLILARQRILKERHGSPVDVVDVDVRPLAAQQCGMAHGATATEQVYEVVAVGQQAHDALCQFVLASLVGQSVFHTL